MKLIVEPIERGVNVLNFSDPVSVLSFAQSCSTKVEPQNGEPKAVKRFHGMEDDFIVQRSAKERMRMADNSSMCSSLGSCIEQRFQPSSRAVKKQ